MVLEFAEPAGAHQSIIAACGHIPELGSSTISVTVAPSMHLEMPRMPGWKPLVVILVFAMLIPSQLSGALDKVSAATPTTEAGLASFYGPGFHGRRTASGILFDMTGMFAAHPTLPFGTILRVTNLATQRSVDVTVIDRGPARRLRRRGVIVDLSQAAAKALGFVHDGRTPVTVRVVRKSTE